MMHPRRITATDSNLRRKIAAHLVTNFQGEQIPTIQQMMAYVPGEINDWKKIKILARDEVIRAATLIDNDDSEKRSRDNTFVKVSLHTYYYASTHFCDTQYIQEIDINAHKRNAPVMFEKRTFYGRILGLLAFEIRTVLSCRTHVLANIAPIKLERKNRLGMPVYKGDKLEPARLVDVSCIQCVIGRVKDKEFWTLIERGEMGGLLEAYEETQADAEN
jgi:hypothetical protein